MGSKAMDQQESQGQSAMHTACAGGGELSLRPGSRTGAHPAAPGAALW